MVSQPQKCLVGWMRLHTLPGVRFGGRLFYLKTASATPAIEAIVFSRFLFLMNKIR